ncbi:MAG: MBL fold metallo-hydrolase [Gammaproteobacteria bacterium]|nr:MBL fold metallo-hydrolase [Gammaproteobacteria bacterium]
MTHPAQHQDLGHGITVLDAEYIQPGIAAVYLMQQGDQVAIIETGTAFTVPHILELLQQRGLSAENIAYVIPTHVHLDHAGGAGELMALCPNAQLIIHPFGARHMIDPGRLQQGVIAVYGEENFKQYYGELKPIEAERVIEAADNFELDFNGRKLVFLDTPGHAKHHFCIYDETSNGIFTGDTFGLSYPNLTDGDEPFIFATTTPVQFDPEAMLNSIDRLMALKPEKMYLTHYSAITPTQSVVEQLKDSVLAFKTIAEKERPVAKDRQQRIEERMMEYMLTQLETLQSPLSVDEISAFLKNDVTLNAQGLEVWLNK